MSNYTPTTQEVRHHYWVSRYGESKGERPRTYYREFDRWLRAHDAEVIATARRTVCPDPDRCWCDGPCDGAQRRALEDDDE